jgi:pSer/pThr/pTyr-binding forkhead associated (FHA) protein
VAPAPDPSLRVLTGFLVSYESTELGVFWPLYQGTNVVGRKGAAPGLDIEIDHPTTSSRHAVIHAAARPGRLRVEDPGSTNGTFVGDHMIEKNKPHELRDGESVRFGGYNVIVKIV